MEELETYSKPLSFRCFQTSIWDETLYKAWSQIVHELILNAAQLEKSLKEFADAKDYCERYLTLFPAGRHATDVRNWLNEAAIGLYRRMGYLPDGVRNMYQPGVDVAFCKPCKELVMRYQPQDQG